VLAFANMLRQDHKRAVEDLLKVTVDIRCITPVSGDLSGQIAADAQRLVATLSALSLSKFDVQYVSSQIEFYERALALLDEHLIPNTYDPFLRAHLVGVHGGLEGHLQLTLELSRDLDADGGQD
jgi:predicted outer membrane protein